MMDIFKGIERIKITNIETGEVKEYSKEYLNKWELINALQNEETIDAEELAKKLGIYICEFDEKVKLKWKEVQAWYIKVNNVTGLYINNLVEDKYSIIKKMLYRIIECDNRFEYIF